MGTENSRKRRRYGAELKAQILAECDVPGASVAKVAMAHGINANIVHGWRKQAREAGAATVPERFVPVAIAQVAPGAGERRIEVELRPGSITVKLSWPMRVPSAVEWQRCTLSDASKRPPESSSGNPVRYSRAYSDISGPLKSHRPFDCAWQAPAFLEPSLR
jgi:transposase